MLDRAFATPFPLSNDAVFIAGHRTALLLAVVVVVSGALTTLLILLLVQHSQNPNMRALQVKVGELIRSSEAGNHWIAAEQRSERELSGLISERAKSVQAEA